MPTPTVEVPRRTKLAALMVIGGMFAIGYGLMQQGWTALIACGGGSLLLVGAVVITEPRAQDRVEP